MTLVGEEICGTFLDITSAGRVWVCVCGAVNDISYHKTCVTHCGVHSLENNSQIGITYNNTTTTTVWYTSLHFLLKIPYKAATYFNEAGSLFSPLCFWGLTVMIQKTARYWGCLSHLSRSTTGACAGLSCQLLLRR